MGDESLARHPDTDDETKNLVRAAFHKIDVNGDGVVQRKEIEALLDEADALDEEQDLEVDSFDTVLTGVDTDGDGVLSIDELISQDPSMDAATKLLLKRAFEEADQNGNRRIDFHEMSDFLREVDEALSLRSEQESLLERRPLHQHVNDGDDALSLHKLFSRYPDMDDDTRNLVRAAFHKIDVNGDGVVQRKEIEALLDDAETLDEEPFLETVTFDTALDATDTDGDGVLSVDELVAQDPTMDAATKLLVKRVFEEADQNGDGRIDDDEFGGFLHALDEKSDEDS